MNIAKTEKQANEIAQTALLALSIKGAFIDKGSYKGGLYDCLFILHPVTGNELFAIAY